MYHIQILLTFIHIYIYIYALGEEYFVFPHEAEGLGPFIICKIRREKKSQEVVKLVLVETKTRKTQQMRNLVNEKELKSIGEK